MNVEWVTRTRLASEVELDQASVLRRFLIGNSITQYWRPYSSSVQKENLWIMQVADDQFHVIQYNRSTGEHEIVHTFPGLESAKAYILLVDEV